MPQKNSNQEEYISLIEATKYCDYTQEYLSLRARQGKLKAKKFGRNWVTTKEWVIEYFGGTNSQKARVQEKKANGPSFSFDSISRARERFFASFRMTEARASLRMTKELRYAIASVLVFVFLGAGFVWGTPTLLSAKDAFVEDLAIFSEEIDKGVSKFSQDVSQISDINLSRVIDKNFPSTRTGARGVVQNFRDGKDFVVDGFSRAGQEIASSGEFVEVKLLQVCRSLISTNFAPPNNIAEIKYGLGYTGRMFGEYTQWLNQTFVKPPSRAVAKNISIATASLTSDKESFYNKYLVANNWVEDKIQKVAEIPEKLSNIFFGADETDLAEQEQEPEQEPEQEIEEAAKEFAETGDMEKLQQRIKELEARGYQQKEIIKEVKKITQIQPVQKITKQTKVIDSQALITLASLEDRINDIEKWEKDIRTLQSITKKLRANPPTTAASTAPIYIGSQGIQVGGAGIFSSLGVSGSTGLSNLGVGGSTSLGSTANDKLTVAATSNFTGPITITNNITHTGAYTQSGGQVTFGGNVDTTAGLDVTGGNLTIGDTNFVVDYTTGDLAMIGNLSLADITADGDVVIAGGLTVGGAGAGAVSFTASSTSAVLNATQTGTGSIFTATSTATMTSDAFIITNLGTGLSFIVQDDNSDASPFVIAADGKVGIGTSTPAYALDVIGTGKFSTSLGVAGTATTTADTISFAGIGNITAVATSTWQTTSGSLAITSANALNLTAAAASLWKTTSGDLTIQSAGALTATSTGNMILAAGGAERMRILASNAYVGIATTTPSYTFDVWGDARFGTSTDGALFVDASTQRIGIGTTTPSVALEVVGSIVGSGNITVAGQAIFNKAPTLAHQFVPSWSTGVAGSNVSDATVYINPQTAVADSNILGIAVDGSVKFLVDAEGDVFVNSLTSAGSVTVGATTVSTLTVENNTILGDASTDTISATARFISDLIPSSDNQYDLGSSAYRWQDIYAVQGIFGGTITIDTDSIVATSTLAISSGAGAALNITGAANSLWKTSSGTLTIQSASTLYATGTDIQLTATTGAFTATSTGIMTFGVNNNPRMTILTDGKIGIGTETPDYALDIVGKCVTGDTLLPIVKSEIEYIRIDDIKGGEMVLSLNEKTGLIEPARINGLMDMGVKPTFKMTTEDKRFIRTTGNHPYLTKNGWKLVANLNKGDEIAVPREMDLLGLSSVSAFQNSVNKNSSSQSHNCSSEIKNSQCINHNVLVGVSTSFDFQRIEKNRASQTENCSSEIKNSQCINHSVSINNTPNIHKNIDAIIPNKNSVIFSGALDEINDGITTEAKNICPKLTDIPETTFICSNDKSGFITSNNNTSDDSVKSDDIQRSDIEWQKIESIEYVGKEQVYDIEVEGTHNFVANGIIAHNTYISSELSVAGTATTTGNKLTFNASSTISSATNALNITAAAASLWKTTGGSSSLTIESASTLTATSSGDITLLSSTGSIINKLGDAAGSDKFYVRDSTGAAQLTLDSNGNMDITGAMYQPVYGTDHGLVGSWDFSEQIGAEELTDKDLENWTTGALNSWTKIDGTDTHGTVVEEPTTIYSGSKSAKLLSKADAGAFGIYQTINVVAGATYQLNAWVDYDSLTAGSIIIEALGDVAGSLETQTLSAVTSDFQFLSIRFTAGASDSTADIKLYMTNETAADKVAYIDLLSVKRVPGAYTYDNSEFGNDGTFQSGASSEKSPSYYDSKYGQGMQFDGADDYVDCGNDSSLDITDAITIEAWVKITDYPTVYGGIVSKGYAPSTSKSWSILINSSGKGYFFVRKDDNSSYSHSGEWSVTPKNTWMYIVNVFKANDYIATYKNGVLDIINETVDYSMYASGSNYDVQIGNIDGIDYPFNGAIDGVKIYNRAISADEIKAHYLRGTETHTDLVLTASSTAGNLYGSRTILTDTSPVYSGTDTSYGQYISATRTGASGGIIKTYGVHSTVTGDTGGTSTTTAGYFSSTGADSVYGVYSTITAGSGATGYGLYIDAGTGAGTEYAAAFLNGNVGIGTATPVAKLDVVGSETNLMSLGSANTATWSLIGGDGTGWANDAYEYVKSLTTFNGKLYAGLGASTGEGELWEYDGSSWTKIGGDDLGWADSTYEYVYSLTTFNGKLYAGVSGTVAGEAEVWEYDGTTWAQIGGDSLNSGWTTNYEIVRSLTTFNGKLYAGLGSSANDAEVWEYDGSSWTQIGGDSLNSGWTTNYERVYSLTTFNGKLYAGLGLSADEAEVWEYNGSSWTQIGGDSLNSGWTTGYEFVSSLTTFNGKLYAGVSGTAAGEAELWEYDGSSWTKIGGDGTGWADSTYEYVWSLTTFNGKLYAGVSGDSAGEAELWEYDGSTWTQIGGDGTGSSWDTNYEAVYSLTTFNGKLYAGLGSSQGDAELWEYDGSSWTTFARNGVGLSIGDYMYMGRNGYVGINNPQPESALDIRGDLTVSGSLLATNAGKVGVGTAAPTAKLSVLESSGELVDFTHGTTHMLTILDEWRTRFATSSVAYFGSMNDRIIDDMEATTLVWTESGNTTTSTDSSTLFKVGDQALKITSTWACEDDLINKTISAEDWSDYERMGFWIYSDRIATTTATTTQMISIELIDSTNGTLAHDITIQAEDQWQYEEWALNATGTSAYDGVTDLQFRIDANTTTTNFYIDHIRLYNENERAGEFFVDASGNLNLFSPNEIEFTRAVPGGSLPSMKLGSAIVEVNQPFAVNVAGDVGINYDLYFAGTGMSQITSAGPMRISAGDSNHAENLTLTTGGKGDIIIDIADSRFGLKTIGNSNLAYVNRLYPEGELEVRNTLFSDMKFIDVAGYYDGATWASTTDEINSYQGTAQTLLADTNDYFYWGCTSTDGFSRLYFDLNAVATTTLNLIWEYSTSTDSIHIPAIDWPNLQGVTTTDDTADGFESDGNIDWTIPGDWGASNMGGIATTTDTFYWIRVHTDTTGWVTAPTAYFAALSRYGSDFIRMATDGTDKFRIDKDGDLYVAGKIGIATANASTSAHIISTSEQLRLAHDTTHYTQFKTDSAGDLRILPTGEDIKMIDGNIWICSGSGGIDSSGCPTITLAADGGYLVVENNVYIDNSKTTYRNYKKICPTGYIWVDGSAKHGTLPGFCVMKYEAKGSSGAVVSTATGLPYINISQTSAQTECQGIGNGYHLITDQEWMTIAEDIANTTINDIDEGTAGIQLSRGLSSNDSPEEPASSLAGADPDISNCNLDEEMGDASNAWDVTAPGICEIRGDGGYTGDANDKGFYKTGDAWGGTTTYGTLNNGNNADDGDGQIRTHVLSNGEVIWDIAGNVWEWTDAYITDNNGTHEMPLSSAGVADNWYDYSSTTDNPAVVAGYVVDYKGLNYIRPNHQWNSTQGIGMIYLDQNCAHGSDGAAGYNATCGIEDHNYHAFIRGGGWSNTSYAGVFTLNLDNAPSNVNTYIGFRCSR